METPKKYKLKDEKYRHVANAIIKTYDDEVTDKPVEKMIIDEQFRIYLSELGLLDLWFEEVKENEFNGQEILWDRDGYLHINGMYLGNVQKYIISLTPEALEYIKRTPPNKQEYCT